MIGSAWPSAAHSSWLMCGVIGASSSATVFQAFLQQRAILGGALRGFFQHVHQRHHLGDGGVEFVVLADVVAGLLDGQVDRAANGLLVVVQRWLCPVRPAGPP